MKTIQLVIVILILFLLTFFAQDKVQKKAKIDTDSQKRVYGIIEAKKIENEAARLKLEEIISSWEKFYNIMEMKSSQDILDAQLRQIETTIFEIRRTSNNNLEAINKVRMELSITTPTATNKPAPPEKAVSTPSRSWSEIVQDQSKNEATQEVRVILLENLNHTLKIQEDIDKLMNSANNLDQNLVEIETARANKQEEMLQQLIEEARSESDGVKELIKLARRKLEEHRERQEQAIQKITN
jgi:hypothetical protein